METAEKESPERSESVAAEGANSADAHDPRREAIWIEPDLDFIQRLRGWKWDSYKKCMQCGTCSATCELSPDDDPFPGKEMAWASWGMKDRLMTDVDVWLCHQCTDCSARCPRGARPGEILSAVRREVVAHYATPGFMGRWMARPRYIPILLGFPVLLLGALSTFKVPIQNLLGTTDTTGDKIIYHYSASFPQWMLNGVFFFFCFLAFLAAVTSVVRFWRALKSGQGPEPLVPVKGLWPSIGTVLKIIFTQEKFTHCIASRPRYLTHVLVLFGFLSLMAVTIWVITSGLNPLIRSEFTYPMSFWNPWKILANLGGAALVIGLAKMLWQRLEYMEKMGRGLYFDWALIWTLLLVGITGFATELLHYARMEPHRHMVYFVHLVFVFALLVYLPYSKLAHIFYRATALVFAEHIGRDKGASQRSGETR